MNNNSFDIGGKFMILMLKSIYEGNKNKKNTKQTSIYGFKQHNK